MHTYKANLVRVIDGDTIVCDIDLGFGIWKRDEHVRLARINTPEVRTRDLEEKRKGLDAKGFVEVFIESRVQQGHQLILETFKDKGKYGRFVANVAMIVEGEVLILNDILVSQGLAEYVNY